MSFSIDRATGQLMTKGRTGPRGKQWVAERHLHVTVRATDPAGVPQAPDGSIVDDPENSAEIEVTITVTDVNEASGSRSGAECRLTFQEVQGTYVVGDNTRTPTRQTDPETASSNDPVYHLVGVGRRRRQVHCISAGGLLTFKAKPDFEKPGDADTDNVYEVTVVAADNDGNRGTMDVKVTVQNEEETGVVALSRTQPRVGVPVTASLTDPDGSISGLRWQWSTIALCDAGMHAT